MLSIVICTYNRSYLIKEQIACFNNQERPANQEVEVIYVNNNSSDDTAAVLQEGVKNCAFPVRIFCETKQGLSHARNRGWQEAMGEYVIYLDDDAFPQPNWLVNYANILAKWQPEVAGGPIVPFSKHSIPAWMDLNSSELNGYIGRLDLGSETRWLNEKEEVWGGNIAVLRTELQSTNGFNPNFGLNGNRRLMGEESELQERIRNKGGKILYVPGASVEHLIAKTKLSLAHFFKYNYYRGVTSVRHERLEVAVPLRECRWKTRSALSCFGKALLFIVTRRKNLFIKYLSQAATYSGAATEILKKQNPST